MYSVLQYRQLAIPDISSNQTVQLVYENCGFLNHMAVALAWILRYPGATQAVIGTTKSIRVREAAKATDVRLRKKEWYEIYLAAGNDLP